MIRCRERKLRSSRRAPRGMPAQKPAGRDVVGPAGVVVSLRSYRRPDRGIDQQQKKKCLETGQPASSPACVEPHQGGEAAEAVADDPY